MVDWRNEAHGTRVSRPTLQSSSRLRRASSSAPLTKRGRPYIQHRGGPRGFLRVLDDQPIGFAEFTANQQYITQGNLADNPKAHLFVVDYAHRRRVKICGEARVVEGHAELTAMLMPEGYKARAEQAILFTVTAWDANYPQHIPQRFDATDVAASFAERDKRIETLETELKQLRLLRNSGVRYDERSVPRREIGIRTGSGQLQTVSVVAEISGKQTFVAARTGRARQA